MKIATSFALVAVFSLLVSCTITPMEMTTAVRSAKTRSDHDALAKHYEDTAKEMQVKSDLHKKLLAEYEAARGIDSRQAHALIDHCRWLIRIYEQAAAENMSMAASHRQLAAEAN
jgi:multidrug efflux pump subunit AcrB